MNQSPTLSQADKAENVRSNRKDRQNQENPRTTVSEVIQTETTNSLRVKYTRMRHVSDGRRCINKRCINLYEARCGWVQYSDMKSDMPTQHNVRFDDQKLSVATPAKLSTRYSWHNWNDKSDTFNRTNCQLAKTEKTDRAQTKTNQMSEGRGN